MRHTDIEHVIVIEQENLVVLELDTRLPHGDPVIIDEQLSRLFGIVAVDVDRARVTITLRIGASWTDALEQSVTKVLKQALDRDIMMYSEATLRA